MHTYENHVQAFMYHVKTEKSAFIDETYWNSFVTPYVLKMTLVQCLKLHKSKVSIKNISTQSLSLMFSKVGFQEKVHVSNQSKP